MDSTALVPQILTPLNYVDYREDMQVSLHNLGLYRMTMGREIEPHHPTEKNKFLNRLDEAFGFLCTHISRDLFFHLKGLKYTKLLSPSCTENQNTIICLNSSSDEVRHWLGLIFSYLCPPPLFPFVQCALTLSVMPLVSLQLVVPRPNIFEK